MPSQLEKQLSRCTLCSMDCPMGAEIDQLGHVRSVFPNEMGGEHGACILGVTAGQLLRATGRVYGASCKGTPMGTAKAVGELARLLSGFESSQVAILVDACRPLEGVGAAAALRSIAYPDGTLALFTPPEDEPLSRAGLGPCPPIGSLADVNLVLAVGDPFSTHPVISSPIRDMHLRGRGNRLISVDSAEGRTGIGSDQSIVLDPYKIAGFLCALAIECGSSEVKGALGGADSAGICAALSLPGDKVKSTAAALKGAKAAAIVLANPRGRYAHAEAVARAAAALAAATGAALYPLSVGGNSLAFGALAQRFSAVNLAALLGGLEAGRTRALVVCGVDPANTLPRSIWQGLREKVEFLAWAGPMRSEFAALADVVVPLALPWEESGPVLLPGGSLGHSESWMAPPEGVLTTAGLMKMLAESSGVGAIAPARPGEIGFTPTAPGSLKDHVTPALLESAEPAGQEAIAVGSPEPYGYRGGLCVMEGSWQQRMVGQERAVVSASLAKDLGLSDGDVIAPGEGGQATLACVVRGGAEAKTVALPAHGALLRELLDWKVTADTVQVNPSRVSVRKVQ